MEELASPSYFVASPTCDAPLIPWHSRLFTPFHSLSADRDSKQGPFLLSGHPSDNGSDDPYHGRQQRRFVDGGLLVNLVWGTLLCLFVVGLMGFQVGKHCQSSIWHATGLFDSPEPDYHQSPRELARNKTLGFEKIYALTRGTPWRVNGLRAAATYTGLSIEEPRQAPIADGMVRAFENLGEDDAERPGHGAAAAWMAHINLLEFVMQSGIGSALIVEDDVDWDVALLDQMPAISDGVRNFTGTPSDDPDPYGSSWDVLWLGHCGEALVEDLPLLAWPDDTVISHDEYSGFARKWIDRLPEAHRAVNPTFTTVCSFAYAVSYESVPKVLDALNRGGDEAFDVALSRACRDSPLRCYTVHPEVMHHYVPQAGDGLSSEVRAGNGEGELGDSSLGFHMGTTDNLVNSTRCHVLWQRSCVGNTWTR